MMDGSESGVVAEKTGTGVDGSESGVVVEKTCAGADGSNDGNTKTDAASSNGNGTTLVHHAGTQDLAGSSPTVADNQSLSKEETDKMMQTNGDDDAMELEDTSKVTSSSSSNGAAAPKATIVDYFKKAPSASSANNVQKTVTGGLKIKLSKAAIIQAKQNPKEDVDEDSEISRSDSENDDDDGNGSDSGSNKSGSYGESKSQGLSSLGRNESEGNASEANQEGGDAHKKKKKKKSTDPNKAPRTKKSYQEMIQIAVVELNDAKGSSLAAIHKFMQTNFNLGDVSDKRFSQHLSLTAKKMLKDKILAKAGHRYKLDKSVSSKIRADVKKERKESKAKEFKKLLREGKITQAEIDDYYQKKEEEERLKEERRAQERERRRAKLEAASSAKEQIDDEVFMLLPVPGTPSDDLPFKEHTMEVLGISEFCFEFSHILKLEPFTAEMLFAALNSPTITSLLREIHLVLLGLCLEPEMKQEDLVVRWDWFKLLNSLTWPEILRRYLVFTLLSMDATHEKYDSFKSSAFHLEKNSYVSLPLASKIDIISLLCFDVMSHPELVEEVEAKVKERNQLDLEKWQEDRSESDRLKICKQIKQAHQKGQILPDGTDIDDFTDEGDDAKSKGGSAKKTTKKKKKGSDIEFVKAPNQHTLDKHKHAILKEIERIKKRKEERAVEYIRGVFRTRIRAQPWGRDSKGNQFYTFKSDSKRMYVFGVALRGEKSQDQKSWRCYTARSQIDELLSSLSTRSHRERNLKANLTAFYNTITSKLTQGDDQEEAEDEEEDVEEEEEEENQKAENDKEEEDAEDDDEEEEEKEPGKKKSKTKKDKKKKKKKKSKKRHHAKDDDEDEEKAENEARASDGGDEELEDASSSRPRTRRGLAAETSGDFTRNSSATSRYGASKAAAAKKRRKKRQRRMKKTWDDDDPMAFEKYRNLLNFNKGDELNLDNPNLEEEEDMSLNDADVKMFKDAERTLVSTKVMYRDLKEMSTFLAEQGGTLPLLRGGLDEFYKILENTLSPATIQDLYQQQEKNAMNEYFPLPKKLLKNLGVLCRSLEQLATDTMVENIRKKLRERVMNERLRDRQREEVKRLENEAIAAKQRAKELRGQSREYRKRKREEAVYEAAKLKNAPKKKEEKITSTKAKKGKKVSSSSTTKKNKKEASDDEDDDDEQAVEEEGGEEKEESDDEEVENNKGKRKRGATTKKKTKKVAKKSTKKKTSSKTKSKKSTKSSSKVTKRSTRNSVTRSTRRGASKRTPSPPPRRNSARNVGFNATMGGRITKRVNYNENALSGRGGRDEDDESAFDEEEDSSEGLIDSDDLPEDDEGEGDSDESENIEEEEEEEEEDEEEEEEDDDEGASEDNDDDDGKEEEDEEEEEEMDFDTDEDDVKRKSKRRKKDDEEEKAKEEERQKQVEKEEEEAKARQLEEQSIVIPESQINTEVNRFTNSISKKLPSAEVARIKMLQNVEGTFELGTTTLRWGFEDPETKQITEYNGAVKAFHPVHMLDLRQTEDEWEAEFENGVTLIMNEKEVRIGIVKRQYFDKANPSLGLENDNDDDDDDDDENPPKPKARKTDDVDMKSPSAPSTTTSTTVTKTETVVKNEDTKDDQMQIDESATSAAKTVKSENDNAEKSSERVLLEMQLAARSQSLLWATKSERDTWLACINTAETLSAWAAVLFQLSNRIIEHKTLTPGSD